jgi:hypothetical protein
MRLIPAAVLLILVLPGTSYAFKFVDGRGQRCDLACEAKSSTAVSSGKYTNGERFFVCTANAEGPRPGYNLSPNWSTTCTVGQGGKEVSVASYQCLCQ